jgi:hypothetical protein
MIPALAILRRRRHQKHLRKLNLAPMGGWSAAPVTGFHDPLKRAGLTAMCDASATELRHRLDETSMETRS